MNKPIYYAIGAGLLLTDLAGAKFIWQSGFDAGADVNMCAVVSVITNDGKLASDHEACKAAEAYKSNPLWLLRRRNGGQSDE